MWVEFSCNLTLFAPVFGHGGHQNKILKSSRPHPPSIPTPPFFQKDSLGAGWNEPEMSLVINEGGHAALGKVRYVWSDGPFYRELGLINVEMRMRQAWRHRHSILLQSAWYSEH